MQEKVLRLFEQGLYSCKEDGTIWSHIRDKPLRPGYCKGKYAHVLLGKRARGLVSNIMWLFFYGPYDDSLEVHHINHNTRDNRLSNLALVTGKENCQAAVKAGVGPAKLCANQVFLVKALLSRKRSNASIARLVGCSERTVSAIKHNKAYSVFHHSGENRPGHSG